MEDILKLVMYESPSDGKIEKVIITEGAAKKKCKPEIIRNENKKAVPPLYIQGVDTKQKPRKRSNVG